MDNSEILEVCKAAGMKYKIDPALILAIVEQESSYRTDEARLENAFYRRYVRPKELATSTEVLLSASYGAMQMMGYSLSEVSYFADYAKSKPGNYAPLSQLNVCKAIDDYMLSAAVQIEYGVRWFMKKLELAKGDVRTALGYWNGDKTGKYSAEVLDRYNKLKKK